jgi:hypothetical protein
VLLFVDLVQNMLLRLLQGLLLFIKLEVMLVLLLLQAHRKVVVEFSHSVIAREETDEVPPECFDTHICGPPDLSQEILVILVNEHPNLLQRHFGTIQRCIRLRMQQ